MLRQCHRGRGDMDQSHCLLLLFITKVRFGHAVSLAIIYSAALRSKGGVRAVSKCVKIHCRIAVL